MKPTLYKCKDCDKTVRIKSVTTTLHDMRLCPQCYTIHQTKPKPAGLERDQRMRDNAGEMYKILSDKCAACEDIHFCKTCGISDIIKEIEGI